MVTLSTIRSDRWNRVPRFSKRCKSDIPKRERCFSEKGRLITQRLNDLVVTNYGITIYPLEEKP